MAILGGMGNPNTLGNWLQLLGSLMIFILVLFAAAFVSKWLATSGLVQPKTQNIELKESFRIGPGKHIQIIKIGKKCYAIGVTKDQITHITDLDEEQLDFALPQRKPSISFKDVMNKVIRKE